MAGWARAARVSRVQMGRPVNSLGADDRELRREAIRERFGAWVGVSAGREDMFSWDPVTSIECATSSKAAFSRGAVPCWGVEVYGGIEVRPHLGPW